MVNHTTVYISDDEFVLFIKALPPERKRIAGIDGKTRWIIKNEDGSEYIARPESSKKDL